MPKPKVRVAADDLRPFAASLLADAGLSTADAETVADAFTWANLRGVDSHGVSRLPRYLELLASGEANPRPAIETTKVRAAALLIDADRAPGPVALTHAMREVIALARETGVAWATVRGTVHTGAIGRYTSLAAAEGMIGVGIVAGVPNMGYAGARGAAVATSPLSIAVPAGQHPDLVLDMATAAIALGRIAQYKANGQELPAGVAVTADGEPTTDPSVAKTPLPMAGAKGSGMSLAFELISSGLADNAIVAPFHDGTPGGRSHRQNATLIAVDISAFLPTDAFAAIADSTLEAVKGLTPEQEGGEVLYPGERGAATAAERQASGIPLPVPLWEKLTAAAEAAGVAVPEPLAGPVSA